jgi:hypothetical protein
MVTFDVKDFTVLARRWAEASRSHAGLGIVVAKQSQWTDLTLFIVRPARDT